MWEAIETLRYEFLRVPASDHASTHTPPPRCTGVPCVCRVAQWSHDTTEVENGPIGAPVIAVSPEARGQVAHHRCWR
jgi:hypothetical protein